MRNVALLLCITGLVGLTPGCLFIPTPHYYAVGSRRNITGQTTNSIHLDKDTIEDVLLRLGEPDNTSQDDRKITYRSKKIAGLIISTADSDPDGGEFPINHYLTVKFDRAGVVTNIEYSSYLGWDLGWTPN